MSALPSLSFDLPSLARAYADGCSPEQVVAEAFSRIRAKGDNPIWITLASEHRALERARALASDARARALPLFCVPFAVKDNIDVAGMTTTAACPAFAYEAQRTSPAVERLLAAGAILIGKTNLDQFATGLVGTRSPYGAVRNAFRPEYISGGSSSGSALAVAIGQVSFAIGTDTAGSGRVPAGLNNIVGLKPTRGRLSAAGVVPACRSLDCLSVLALTCDDAMQVVESAQEHDRSDPYSRHAEDLALPERMRLGVPRAPEFCGDPVSARLFAKALESAQALGFEVAELDFSMFHEAGALLYEGPWIAERHAAVGDFLAAHADAVLPVTRDIILQATKFSATDLFRAQYRLAELKCAARAVFEGVDALMVPTAPTVYTRAEVETEPLRRNTELGRYTNFVNLLDLAAIAVPDSIRSDGLPFGVTFIAPAWTDAALARLGARWHARSGMKLGATGARIPDYDASRRKPGNRVHLAVVGAHLSGMPLNHELTGRRARLLRATRTAPAYVLYALAGSAPPKPGLIRAEGGRAIEVEVWELDERDFGAFAAGIPPPLGIGTVTLEDGSEVKGFLCEGYAARDAVDISSFGGWRAYVGSLQAASEFSGSETP